MNIFAQEVYNRLRALPIAHVFADPVGVVSATADSVERELRMLYPEAMREHNARRGLTYDRMFVVMLVTQIAIP